MSVATGAGVKIYISNATSTAANQSQFEALTWIEIEQTEAIGDFGDTTAAVNWLL